jgi:predicted RNA-binding Zn-ribbon protein involved in translation (DUF1610 family)
MSVDVASVVYECPNCEERSLEHRCPECNMFLKRLTSCHCSLVSRVAD